MNLPNAVPPSFKTISVPSTSITKSPPISKVKSPLSEIVEPFKVISSTVSVVKPVIPDAVMHLKLQTSPFRTTVNTSIPDESFTSNKLPLFESVTVNSSPFEPDIVNIVFPLFECLNVVDVSPVSIFELITVCVRKYRY